MSTLAIPNWPNCKNIKSQFQVLCAKNVFIYISVETPFFWETFCPFSIPHSRFQQHPSFYGSPPTDKIVYDWRIAFTVVKWKQTPITRKISSCFSLCSVLAWVLIFEEFILGQHSLSFPFPKECLGFFCVFLTSEIQLLHDWNFSHECHFEVTKLFEE